MDFAVLFQAIVLGIVQGITEFLPISSTAHLIIFTDIFHWRTVWNKAAIDAIQFGSVLAVIWYFRRDIYKILTGAWSAFQHKDWQREEWKILVGIAIGTIPALAGGLILKALDVELDQSLLIAVMSIAAALLLGLAEKIGIRKRGFDQLQILDGVLVGLGQMVALLPGASRSGSTLTAGLFLGLKRETAARFSFLLGIPTLAIATLVQTGAVIENRDMMLPMLVGIISTFIFSYLSIAWLLKFLQRQSTWIFVWYRIALGIALLIAIAGGVLR
ncbi:undecaprenyl-diphosphate phosphatase [Leptolyngbya sp. FACHB-1515]|uniref:undecaprenyl-diphosphate phosphatase n=1 Tax=Leptolyngbya sp. FACHB-1515 TaxID=2933931 RepID=UPI003296FA0E